MYGIFSYDNATLRVGWKYGHSILDLEAISSLGYFDGLNIDIAVFTRPVLNDFIALGTTVHQAVQQRLTYLLENDANVLASVQDQVLVPESRTRMHLPVHIGDYTDFYAGIHHAENVGRMFRPTADPLLPNYVQMPIAYHGRASSIVTSGTPIRRPSGQFMQADQLQFGPSQALDFELELGLIIGKASQQGEPIPIEEAEDYIFGVVLFNDWSARDIQRWEYQPLGPFLGKNFASSLSAWVVPFYQLDPFRVAGPVQKPTPFPYLCTSRPGHFDLDLEVWLQPTGADEICISQTNTRYLYWSFAQMIAHHTVGGCNLNVGDVLATGTISGSEPGSYGSLLELSWNGQRPLHVSALQTRTFLADGDTVTFRGRGRNRQGIVGLGDVVGTVTL